MNLDAETMIPALAGLAAAALAAALPAWLRAWRGRAVADPSPQAGPDAARAPRWFHPMRGLARALGRRIAPRLSWRMRRALDARLGVAGVQPALDAVGLVGAQAAFGLSGIALAALLATAMGASGVPLVLPGLGAAAGAAWPRLWLRDRLAARRREIVRALPFALDMITLCVEAGLNLQGALQQAVLRGPPGALRDELRHVLGDMRAGMVRADALRALSARVDEAAVRAWVTALIQAEATGMSLGPLLRSQSDQRRQDRFLRAETLALEAPVKLLLPLVAFIFPCTFLVIGFPIAVRLMEYAP